MRKVFLENLPRWEVVGRHKGKINWLKSIGYKVRFIYDDIEGWVEIINYQRKESILYVKYLDNKPLKIYADNFKNCKIGKILGKITNEFKIEIGTHYKDEKRDLIIIDRKIEDSPYKEGAKLKYYKYKCNKCGFECGEHYKDGEFKEEHRIVENSLIKGSGCACCCSPSQIVVPNINSIVANPETQWMIKYFQGDYDEAKMYTRASSQKINPVCPYCGRVKSKRMKITDLYTNKSIGCTCEDSIKYPEKLMFNILEQLNIDFIFQLTKLKYNWCGNYRYDFYFELNDKKYIIETHGKQHYEDAWNKLENTQLNDKIKKELALNNNIKEENYIVINCKKSELEWIRDNVLNSRLNDLFDLSKIDWNKCEEFALSNLVKIICDIKRDNPDMTTADIGGIMKLSCITVAKYLKKGTKLGWCNYDAKEEMKKVYKETGKKVIEKFSKPLEMFRGGISLGVYESGAYIDKQSEILFGIKLHQRSISEVAMGIRTSYKGFTFKYVEKENNKSNNNQDTTKSA